MRHISTASLLISISFPIVTTAQGVKADSPTAPASDAGEASEGESTALGAFESGKSLYKDGKFIEASKYFREADHLRPSWKLYFNIGQSEAGATRNGLALEAFERYLTQGGDSIPEDRREYVLKEIARLRPIVGFLDISAPEGAIIYVNDFPRATAPLSGPLMIAAGRDHNIRIDLNDITILTRGAKVPGGETITITASAPDDLQEGADEEAMPAQKTQITSTPSKQTTPSWMSPLGWSAAGTGAALLIAGTVTGSLALSKSQTLKNNCPENQCDTSDRNLSDSIHGLAIATDVMIPTGAIIAATGIVLVILGRSKTEKNSAASHLIIAPVAGFGHNGMVIEGSF